MTEPPIEGIAFCWAETGTEGLLWSVQDQRSIHTSPEGRPAWDYAGLHVLSNGDRLRLFGPTGRTLWAGVIDLDPHAHWRPYPQNPAYGQPNIAGFWVHGVQRGVPPRRWLRWFQAESRALLWPKSTSG